MRKTLIMLAILVAIGILAGALWMARDRDVATVPVPLPAPLTKEDQAKVIQRLMSTSTPTSTLMMSAEIKRQQAILNSLQSPPASATSTSKAKPQGMSPEEQKRILESLQAK